MKCRFFCDANILPNLHDYAKTSPKNSLRKHRENFFRKYAPLFIEGGGHNYGNYCTFFPISCFLKNFGFHFNVLFENFSAFFGIQEKTVSLLYSLGSTLNSEWSQELVYYANSQLYLTRNFCWTTHHLWLLTPLLNLYLLLIHFSKLYQFNWIFEQHVQVMFGNARNELFQIPSHMCYCHCVKSC